MNSPATPTPAALRSLEEVQDDEYTFPYHYIPQYRAGQFRQNFNDEWGINYVSTIEFMLQRIGARHPDSIVDVGCGDGRFARELATFFPDRKIVGIDHSKKAVTLARAMNQDRDVEFLSLDITKSSTDRKFDAAVLMEVLEHVPPPRVQDFLKGVRGLLKEGGHLFVTVPHVNKATEYKHYQHFSSATLSACVAEAFSITEIIPFERRGPLRKALQLCLSNRLFVLNSPRLLRGIYRLYKDKLFRCESEKVCQRLYLEAVAK